MTEVEETGRVISNNPQGDKIMAIIERVEALESEKAAVADDIKHVYSEAKEDGFAVKIIRRIVSARKRSKEAVREENELFRQYLEAIDQGDLFD